VGIAKESQVGFDPFESVVLGRTGLRVTRLAFGAATIGGLFREVSESEAIATARHAADIGIRYFDAAPVYGYGNSERRLGAAVAHLPRDSYVLSTKVGRLLVPRDGVTDDMDVDYQQIDGQEDYFYRGTPAVRPVFDYSHDGVLRSVEASLERLGVDRVDMLFIHDPDNHWQQAMTGAYPALEGLRAQGVVRGIGVGMNSAAMLARFAREGDFDVFLVANRYTLLDQEAAAELFPISQDRGVAIVLGGVLNSGILADPRPGSRFGYLPANDALVNRAQAMRAVCERHGVPLRAAAIQFALAHPVVTAMLAGARTSAQLDDYPLLMRHAIPGQMWDELKAEGLLSAAAVVPDPPDLTASATPSMSKDRT
jgi:D-threo-aldose 1-dehydrogenase